MCGSAYASVLNPRTGPHPVHHDLASVTITMISIQNIVTECCHYCVLQSLLTARWPLELQQNKHSCIKQLQDVYLSADSFGSIVGSADLRGKVADDTTEFLDLSQVSVWLPSIARVVLCCVMTCMP